MCCMDEVLQCRAFQRLCALFSKGTTRPRTLRYPQQALKGGSNPREGQEAEEEAEEEEEGH